MLGLKKHTGARLRNLIRLRKSYEIDLGEVESAREYVAKYWEKLERFHPKDQDNLIGLPHPYLVPSSAKGHEFDYDEMYYWDSYFMVQGMLDEKHRELVVGMLENLLYMFERFKIIPNASRLYLTSRTQPPFLTSFIWDVYDAYKMDDKWLDRAIKIAEAEYQTVWMGVSKPNARKVYRGLSRYYDFNYLNDIAEAESGWDYTPRFGRKCLDYLPVDLNSLLFKYEMDFARYYRLTGDKKTASKWELAAKHRRSTMHDLMWVSSKGLYYDYNFVKHKRGAINSLASYYAMWAGLVDETQAMQMVKAMKRFEKPGGLATTDAQQLGQQLVPGNVPTQWAHPNGWAPLHFLVVKGLQRYGYKKEAERVAKKWLRTNLDWYNRHHIFLEKYNVVEPNKPPLKGVYPSQTGFGWTNAIFERFCQDYLDK